MKLIVHEIKSDEIQEYEPDQIPPSIRWAFDHIIAQDCGSISVGSTVYEVRQ